MSLNVEYSNKEINEIIIKNVLKMLERRNLIVSSEKEYKDLGEINKSNFELILSNKSKCGIYLVNAKLSSIVQGTPLDDYLSNNLEIHKIIVMKEAAKKVVKQIVSEYKNAEFFFESEMLEDIPAKVFIPVHQLLTEEEKKSLLEKFNKQELPDILVTDMMARYYGAKLGDIFRIIRPSITSGESVYYRKVVNGSLDLLFGV